MINEGNFVIFTDLDGTLLDPLSYSYALTKPIITELIKRGIPIIFCSSKTRAEQLFYRQKLGVKDPFIVEDGGAIFIKRGYFPFRFPYQRVRGSYHIIELGKPYKEIRTKVKEISKEHNLKIRGFGDMTPEEVAKLTGLSIKLASLAKKREYEETLNLEGEEEEIKSILQKIEDSGLTLSRGGRFFSVSVGNDKGRATKILTQLLKRKLGHIKVIGIGDSLNDAPMLSQVDLPILVQKPGGYWEEIKLENLHRVEGIGPEGWVRAVEKLLLAPCRTDNLA